MDPSNCSRKALFLHGLSGDGAVSLWLNLMIIFQPWITLAAVYLASSSAAQYQHHRGRTRSCYGGPEKPFVICTVMVGIAILLFMIQALCIQVERFCGPSSISIGSYVGQWVVFCIIDGAMLGTSIQAWINCMIAVRKPPPSGRSTWTPWWGFMAVEAGILSSPLLLLGMLLLVPIKGTESCREWRVVRYFQDWKSKQRGPRTVWREWQAKRREGKAEVNAVESKSIPQPNAPDSTMDLESPPPAYMV